MDCGKVNCCFFLLLLLIYYIFYILFSCADSLPKSGPILTPVSTMDLLSRTISLLLIGILCTSGVDPNPKESEYFGWIRIRRKFEFGFGFGSRHCCKIKILWKIAYQTLEREKTYVFQFSVVQIPEHIWKHWEAPF
jgi:hypothetical protein